MLPSPDPSLMSNSSGDSPTPSECRISSSPPHPRKPIPRKGHTKSRRGCYSCKRRRIKCSETHPQCYHCDKAGLQCEYPVKLMHTARKSPTTPSPETSGSLQSPPGMFSMADMRLFHHFLVTTYSHLPVGADKIWTSVIPSFAHNYEYLIHSILALAASHLDAVSSSCIAAQAIQHRILAVKSLNQALSTPPKTQCERDARMAATLALAFQSSLLEDGMAEFLLMIRGCNIIARDETREQDNLVFNPFQEDAHLLTLQTPLGTSLLQQIPATDLAAASTSLNALHSLPMAPHEQTYHRTLLQTIANAYANDPVSTYKSFTSLYNLPSTWSPPVFSSFISPSSAVAQILLAHFIAVQVVLTPLLYLERRGFGGVEAPTKVLGWVEGVYWGVSGELRGFMEGARGVARPLEGS